MHRDPPSSPPLKLALGATILALLGACSFCSGQGGGETSADAPRESEPGDATAIDGQRALAHIREIIRFGPRHAGTPGAEKTRAYILEKLRGSGLEPRRHDFKAFTPHPALKEVMMANLSVDIPGPGEKGVIIGGHFDGKLLDGVEFKGANDGGSSTALLLELARVLAASPPPCPVKLVFFDGEEALLEWTDSDSRYGSKRMAGELKASGEIERIAAVVIVDMIGDARLKLLRDTKSTRWVFAALESTARRLGHGRIFEGRRAYIDDDHTPFLEMGVPAAVLIDLDFGPGWLSNSYWHTEKDSIDKLSPKSIEIVGQIVLESLGVLSRGGPGAGKERTR